MRLAIKYAGIVLVFAFSVFLGSFKSFSKREYIKRLKKIVSAFERADSMLRLGAINREKIISEAFSIVDNIKYGTDGTVINDKEMHEELKVLTADFFSEFGSGDITAERDRIQILKKEFSAEICRQETEYATYGRLWRTAGVCVGLAFCIMLI